MDILQKAEMGRGDGELVNIGVPCGAYTLVSSVEAFKQANCIISKDIGPVSTGTVPNGTVPK